MKDGNIVEHNAVRALFSDPQHDYTKLLINAEPSGNPPAIDQRAPLVIETRDLKVHFPILRGLLRRTVGHVKAVDGISLEVRAGQTLGVVGESGSGKSTLGQALRLLPSDGPIKFEERDIQGWKERDLRPLRRQIQIVFQDPFSQPEPAHVCFSNYRGGTTHTFGIGATHAERRQRVADSLHEVGLDASSMDRFPHEFSGGQRQRIAIARAMILEPRFVGDEPTSALDKTVQAQIIELLLSLQRKHGLAYLFISHDLKVVRAMASEVIVMKDGLVVEHGPTEHLFDAPQKDYTRALLPPL